ncbi:cytochrome P450 [Cubamyces lactineus]|nr:cytochrome P450 [Cubamyces lactineus]
MTQGAAEALRAFHAYLHDASVQHVGAVAPLVKFESTTFAICACVVALLAMRFLFGRKASAMRLPPGPKGLPIVGNLFDMPRKTYWKTFTDWSEQYGDVVHLRILGRSVILLNSAESTTDLLENRTTIYSDRPKFPIMDMVGHHWNFGFMQYGKQWRELRRLFSTQYSSVKGLQMFYDSHRDSMSRLLLDVLKNPDAFVDHLRLRAGRLIIDVTYGIMIESVDDPLLKVAGDMMDVTSIGLSPPMWLANPAALMEFIPKWLGGSALSLKIQRWRADLEQFRTGAFAMCKERLNKGGSRPSYTASLLQEMSPSDGSHEEGMIRDTAALAYGAAFETSAASAEILILTMALNPEIQKRAQEEIDRVVGTHRLPDFSDREHLPYITAVMKEALRWHPPAPTGIPHQLKEDDTYNGFHLPAGSIVMGNIWSITHDEKRYPEPFAFKPERYLAADGSLDCTANDPARFVFGFGRRVCPGKFLAEDSLWLTTAQFLAVFDISFANPKSVPEIEWHSGAITRPYPVGYSIRPRSDAAKHLIECSVRE